MVNLLTHTAAFGKPHQRASRRQQAGAMLLEILVSILIFSFGVLALVGLQGSMTRAQTEAEMRAEASFLASEALGLMWGDLSNLSSYHRTGCNSYNPCVTWQAKISSRLPNGQGTISVLPAAGGQGQMAEITITWQHSNGDVRTYRAISQLSTAG